MLTLAYMISIVLMGAGNLACHLFKVFNSSKEVSVIQWYNRSLEKIQSYSSHVNLCYDVNDLKLADIYIMAVSDDAIAQLSNLLPFENRRVVHTSGSVSIHALNKKHKRGVFYPLQTFSKNVDINFENVPFCVEALEKEDLNVLKALAQAINSPVYKISTEQRQTLHLAAVFVNNFANHLFRIGHEITDIKHINFDILKPLIHETAKKVQNVSPYIAQTGPALRNDKSTIKRHLKLLTNETHKEIYTLLTNSIKQTHGI